MAGRTPRAAQVRHNPWRMISVGTMMTAPVPLYAPLDSTCLQMLAFKTLEYLLMVCLLEAAVPVELMICGDNAQCAGPDAAPQPAGRDGAAPAGAVAVAAAPASGCRGLGRGGSRGGPAVPRRPGGGCSRGAHATRLQGWSSDFWFWWPAIFLHDVAPQDMHMTMGMYVS